MDRLARIPVDGEGLMGKYRTKPVSVEAMQWDGTDAQAYRITAWAHAGLPPESNSFVVRASEYALSVRAPQGLKLTVRGDWIVKDANGDFCVMTPGNFAAMYEPVPEPLGSTKEDGCTCQKCLRKYKVDLLVSDEWWDRINPEDSDSHRAYELLCGSCIMGLIEARSSFSAFRLDDIIDGED